MSSTSRILDRRGVQPSEPATREVRIAASFSGGVSLAVWMGGVATELQAFARGDTSTSPVYQALLELTGSEPVIDILAGTSAGGINGSALALALANGGDVRKLRDVWLEAGDLQQLLRDPFETNPSSVLRGDAHLGTNLVAGLDAVLAEPIVPPPPWTRSLRLTVTTTVLAPTIRRYRDALDRQVHTNVHLGLMRFLRPDLVPEGELAQNTVVGRLAIASRASASYPGGFEAASVPVGESLDGRFYGQAELAGIADFPASTWALDGGLLLNEPLDPLIADVMDQPASHDVRRFVLQITPDPGEAPAPAPLGGEPDLFSVLKTTLLLPRDRHIADELDRVVRHNLAVRRYDRRRAFVLERAGEDGISDAERDIAQSIIARDVAERVLRDPSLAASPAVVRLSSDAGSGVVEQLGVAYEATPVVDGPRDVHWSPAVIRHAALVGLDLVRAVWPDAVDPPVGLPSLRESLGTIIAKAHWLEEVERRAWVAGVAAPGADVVDLAAVEAAMAGDVGDGADYPTALTALVGALEEALDNPLRKAAFGPLGFDGLARVGLVLAASGGPRFVQPIDVVQLTANAWTVVGKGDGAGLRDHTTAAGDVISNPAEKLRGLEFMRFAAFHKRSWRANDWMWGRLDATTHLCAMLLDVDRLRNLYGDGWQEVTIEVLEDLAGPGELPEDVAAEIGGLPDDATELPMTVRWLAARHQRAILCEELPVVAAGVRSDREAGSTNKAAEQFADSCPSGLVPTDALAGVLSAYRVHHERMADEAKTPLGIANATQLAAVGVAATSSERSGLPSPIRAVIGALRGVTLLVAVMAQGMRRRPGATVGAIAAAAIGLSVLVLFDVVAGVALEESTAGLNYGVVASLVVGLLAYGVLIRVSWVAPVVAVVALGVAGALLLLVGDERYVVVIIGYVALVAVLLVILGLHASGSKKAPSPAPIAVGTDTGGPGEPPAGASGASKLRRLVGWLLLSVAVVVGIAAAVVFVKGPEVTVASQTHRCPLFGAIEGDEVKQACAPYVGHLRLFSAGLVLLVVSVGVTLLWMGRRSRPNCPPSGVAWVATRSTRSRT